MKIKKCKYTDVIAYRIINLPEWHGFYNGDNEQIGYHYKSSQKKGFWLRDRKY